MAYVIHVLREGFFILELLSFLFFSSAVPFDLKDETSDFFFFYLLVFLHKIVSASICILYILWYATVTSVVCWCIFLLCSSCVEFIKKKIKKMFFIVLLDKCYFKCSFNAVVIFFPFSLEHNSQPFDQPTTCTMADRNCSAFVIVLVSLSGTQTILKLKRQGKSKKRTLHSTQTYDKGKLNCWSNVNARFLIKSLCSFGFLMFEPDIKSCSLCLNKHSHKPHFRNYFLVCELIKRQQQCSIL